MGFSRDERKKKEILNWMFVLEEQRKIKCCELDPISNTRDMCCFFMASTFGDFDLLRFFFFGNFCRKGMLL